MGNDLFGGLGGLMKGLSNFMPQDDPNTQLFKLQAEVTDLKKKENDLYARLEVRHLRRAQVGGSARGSPQVR